MEMNLQKYLAFVTTVETGSITKAAEKLNYSQSGISRMIADLEKEWNLSLLERNKYGVHLTSDGAQVLPYAQKLCTEFNKVQMQIKDIQGFQSGLIRIGTFSSAATHWLPRIIKEFRKDYPGIDYEILLGDYIEIEEWIREGRVDCGFLIAPTPEELDTIHLYDDPLLVVMPGGHPYAEAEAFPLEQLEKESFMLLKKGPKGEVSPVLKEHDLHPRVQFTTLDDYAVMAMVENGLGIAILPELILKRNPYKIVTRPLEKPAFRKIYFALKDRETASLAVKRFMDYLNYRNGEQDALSD